MIPASIEDQIRAAIRATAQVAESAPEREALNALAAILSDGAARQLRRMIR